MVRGREPAIDSEDGYNGLVNPFLEIDSLNGKRAG